MNIPEKIKSICVYGVGGVGGFFGGLMAERIAENGGRVETIAFIARGAHLEQIRLNGLILKLDDKRRIVCRPHMATDILSEIPIPDVCFLCVKSYDLDAAVDSIALHMNENTIIVPLLNGVDIYERIRARLKKGIVLPACVYVGTHIEKPGIVAQKGGDGIVLFGNDPQFPNEKPTSLISLLNELGIKNTYYPDPYPSIWTKYVFIAAYGLVTAAFGKTLGEVIADDELRATTLGIMNEIFAIAKKKGIELENDAVRKALEKANSFPFETKTSLQRDVQNRTGFHEADLFGGTIIRMGDELGISTGNTRSVWEKLLKRTMGISLTNQ